MAIAHLCGLLLTASLALAPAARADTEETRTWSQLRARYGERLGPAHDSVAALLDDSAQFRRNEQGELYADIPARSGGQGVVLRFSPRIQPATGQPGQEQALVMIAGAEGQETHTPIELRASGLVAVPVAPEGETPPPPFAVSVSRTGDGVDVAAGEPLSRPKPVLPAHLFTAHTDGDQPAERPRLPSAPPMVVPEGGGETTYLSGDRVYQDRDGRRVYLEPGDDRRVWAQETRNGPFILQGERDADGPGRLTGYVADAVRRTMSDRILRATGAVLASSQYSMGAANPNLFIYNGPDAAYRGLPMLRMADGRLLMRGLTPDAPVRIMDLNGRWSLMNTLSDPVRDSLAVLDANRLDPPARWGPGTAAPPGLATPRTRITFSADPEPGQYRLAANGDILYRPREGDPYRVGRLVSMGEARAMVINDRLYSSADLQRGGAPTAFSGDLRLIGGRDVRLRVHAGDYVHSVRPRGEEPTPMIAVDFRRVPWDRTLTPGFLGPDGYIYSQGENGWITRGSFLWDRAR
ncbi:MAG TPA: hypothetical protein VNI01_01425 [Elusimicrobiota bacterium]|nr:hypothetical protein [Elusimicrobiota bacterium]